MNDYGLIKTIFVWIGLVITGQRKRHIQLLSRTAGKWVEITEKNEGLSSVISHDMYEFKTYYSFAGGGSVPLGYDGIACSTFAMNTKKGVIIQTVFCNYERDEEEKDEHGVIKRDRERRNNANSSKVFLPFQWWDEKLKEFV